VPGAFEAASIVQLTGRSTIHSPFEHSDLSGIEEISVG